jgi:hypothetical protein
MSSLKKSLMQQGMKLMSDPRVLKLMQDERVMKAVMQMMAVPGMVQSFTHEQVERLVKSMALATEDEVKDLRRTVRRLEEELARMKHTQQALQSDATRSTPDDRPSARSVVAKKKAAQAECAERGERGDVVTPVAPEPRFRLASGPARGRETKRRDPWPTRSSGCQSSSQGSGRRSAKMRGGSVPR